MGPSEVGLDPDRLAICGNRLLELVLPKQRVAEVGISLSEVGLDADRPPACGNRLIELALPRQRIAEVGMSLSQVGLDPDRLAICGDRLVELALAHQRVAEPKLQSFLMSKTYLKSDHFQWGRITGATSPPAPQTTATCVRFVTPNLRMICRT